MKAVIDNGIAPYEPAGGLEAGRLMEEEVRIFPDAGMLAAAAAEVFGRAVEHASAAKRGFAVALSGGSTPRALFRILGAEYRDSIRWDIVHFFWTDERAVPPEDEQSNFRLAYQELISKIPIPEHNIHRIRGEAIPEIAALDYETELRSCFGVTGVPAFDLILLGLGEDGHTASLFPGAGALQEKKRLAVPVYAALTGNWRVTLTMPVLNNASNIVFLVSGASKTEIVSEVLGKGKRRKYPAGLVAPVRGRIAWLIDREAASMLENEA